MTEQILEEPQKLVFIQSRAETNYDLVDEYAEMMKAGIEFDAAQGIRDDNGQVYIWDGLHRGEAARLAGELLLVEVKPGTKQEAEWLALSANQKHGLRRTHQDKQRIVRNALLHPYGVSLSDREIARHCGVDHKTVGKIRTDLETTGEIPQLEARRVTKASGETYQIDTRNIGSQQAYIPVWQLETAIRTWLAQTSEDQDAQREMLEGIKHRTAEGQQDLENLLTGDTLPAPRRKSDVIQACHNILAQLSYRLQSAAGAGSPFTLNGRHSSSEPIIAPHGEYEPKAQEFECPRCGLEKIVGVNGSRRWCLNCGAEWPTATAFLAEVETQPHPELRRSRLETLQRRFVTLLAGLDEHQLEMAETWLDGLARDLAVENTIIYAK